MRVVWGLVAVVAVLLGWLAWQPQAGRALDPQPAPSPELQSATVVPDAELKLRLVITSNIQPIRPVRLFNPGELPRVQLRHLETDSVDREFAMDPPAEPVDPEFALDPQPSIDPDFVTPEELPPPPGTVLVSIDDGSDIDEAMLKAMREELKAAKPGSMWARFLRRRIANAEKRLREKGK